MNMQVTNIEIATHFSADGTEVKFLKKGSNPDKPNLIIVLPFGLEIEPVLPLMDALANYSNVLTWESRLILADKNAPVDAELLTVEKHIQDLLSLLDTHFEGDKTSLLGYCSGAGIALAAAKTAPDKIDRVILASGEFVLFDVDGCVTAHANDIDQLLPMASENIDTAAMVLKLIQTASSMMENDAPAAVRIPYTDPVYFHRLALNYKSYRASKFNQISEDLEHDTLILSGDADDLTNVRSAKEIHSSMKNASLVVVPDGDHYELFRSNPTYMEKIESFITKGS